MKKITEDLRAALEAARPAFEGLWYKLAWVCAMSNKAGERLNSLVTHLRMASGDEALDIPLLANSRYETAYWLDGCLTTGKDWIEKLQDLDDLEQVDKAIADIDKLQRAIDAAELVLAGPRDRCSGCRGRVLKACLGGGVCADCRRRRED